MDSKNYMMTYDKDWWNSPYQAEEITLGKKNLLHSVRRCTDCKYYRNVFVDSGGCDKFDGMPVDGHVYCDCWEKKGENG